MAEFTPEEIEERKQQIIDKHNDGDLSQDPQYSQEPEEGENPYKSDEGENPEKSDDSATPEEIKRRDAQIAHYRKKYEKAEAELKKLNRDKPSESAPQGEKDEWRSKVEFLLQNRDYSEEEFDHIANVAARKGVGLKEAAESEKDYIQFKREKVVGKNKTPEPSSPFSSDFEKTSEDIEKMSPKEFKEFMKSDIKKRVGGQGL
jgi:hypothetical protein